MREAQRIAKIGDFVWDVDTGEVTWSDGLFELLGYDKSEAIDLARVNAEIHHPDDLERVNRWLQDCIASGQTELASNEYRLIRRDGEVIDVHVVVVIKRQNGSTRVFGTAQDITGRKRTEELRHQSEERYRTLFEYAPYGILIADDRSYYVDANDCLCQMLGYTRQEFIGLHASDIVAEAEIPRIKPALNQIQATSDYRQIWQFRRKDGSMFHAEVAVTTLPDGHFLGIIQDITERQKWREAIVKSEERLIEAQRIAKTGDFAWDVETGEVTWSNALFELLQYDRSEAIDYARVNAQIHHPDDAERVDRWLHACAGSRTVERASNEYRLIRKDDTVIDVHVVIVIKRISGQTTHVIGTVQDITERKRVERTLEESRNRWKAALDSMTDAVFITDANRRFVEYNEEFLTHHRFTSRQACPGDLADWPDIFDVYFPDGTVAPLEMWAVPKALRGETATDTQYILQRKDTGQRWIGSYNFAPIRNQDGQIVGSVVVGRDVTESRQAELELRRNRELLNETQRVSKLGGWEYEVSTGKITWTDEVYRIHGVSKEQYDPADPDQDIQFYASEDQDRISDVFHHALETGEPYSLELRLINAEGDRLWVQTSGQAEYSDGKIVRLFGNIVDITERKEAEDLLRTSEEKYRLLFESMSEGFVLHEVITDEQGRVCDFRFLEINPACERLTGMRRDELLGRRMREFAYEPVWIERYSAVAVTGKPEHFEEYSTTLDRWFEVFTYQPKPGQCAAVFLDITNRKQAEHQLDESRRQLATLMSNLPGMAYRCLNQPGWPMEFVSEGALELTGYSPTELAGSEHPQYGDLVHPDDRSVVWDGVQKALESGVPFILEYRLLDRQGREHWVWEQGQGIADRSGQVVCVEGFISDITERKMTELALRDSEERFRGALENIPDVVVIYDSDLRIRYINAATQRVTGLPASHFIGKRDDELWPEEQYKSYLSMLKKSFSSDRTLSLETEFVLPGREPRYLRITCVPLADDNGVVREVLGITHDFTERKLSEERIRRTQQQLLEQQQCEKERVQEELEKVRHELVRSTRLAAIGQVSASIAHDLRNPLGAVHNAKYLLKQYLHQPEERITRQLQVIDQEIRRSNRIITNLLNLARAREPDKQEISLNQLVQEVLVETPLPEGVTWQLDTEPNPFLVYADPSQLKQVVENLLANAVEAMDQAGRFVIEARREEAGDVLHFRDSGPGFSMEIEGDPLEPLVTTKTTGTGLGLTICRDIIVRHGGTLTIQNDSESGAVVCIDLPRPRSTCQG